MKWEKAIFEAMETRDTISLSEQNVAVVNEQLASGEFDDPNEVIEAGLSLLQEKQKLAELKAALKLGEESGFVENYNRHEHLNSLKESHKG